MRALVVWGALFLRRRALAIQQSPRCCSIEAPIPKLAHLTTLFPLSNPVRQLWGLHERTVTSRSPRFSRLAVLYVLVLFHQCLSFVQSHAERQPLA